MEVRMYRISYVINSELSGDNLWKNKKQTKYFFRENRVSLANYSQTKL